MSVVWNDEYDPSELDGFQVETELDWIMQDDRNANAFDEADKWLADEAVNHARWAGDDLYWKDCDEKDFDV